MYNPLDELGSEVERAFTFENGDTLYVDYDEKDNILFAGHATNAGVMKEVKIQYDKDDTLYENLERLHEACIEDDPSRLDEEKTTDSKEAKKGVVVNVGKKDSLRRKAKDENHKLSAEEVAMTKAIYVRTPEDKEVWNSLTEEEKWLLRMSADQGFWWDLEDKDKERVNRLERKFSSFKGLSDGKKTKDSGKWTFVILEYNDNVIYEDYDTYSRKSEAEDAATDWIADLALEVEYDETEDGWDAYYDNGNIEIASGCETKEEAEKLVDEWIDKLYYEVEKSTYDGKKLKGKQDSKTKKVKRNTKDEIIAGIDDWVIKEVIDKVRDIDDKGGVVEYKRMMDFIKSLSEDLSEFDCYRIYNYIRNKYDSGKIWDDGKKTRDDDFSFGYELIDVEYYPNTLKQTGNKTQGTLDKSIIGICTLYGIETRRGDKYNDYGLAKFIWYVPENEVRIYVSNKRTKPYSNTDLKEAEKILLDKLVKNVDANKYFKDSEPKGKRFKLKTSKHDSTKFIVRRLRRK